MGYCFWCRYWVKLSLSFTYSRLSMPWIRSVALSVSSLIMVSSISRIVICWVSLLSWWFDVFMVMSLWFGYLGFMVVCSIVVYRYSYMFQRCLKE